MTNQEALEQAKAQIRELLINAQSFVSTEPNNPIAQASYKALSDCLELLDKLQLDEDGELKPIDDISDEMYQSLKDNIHLFDGNQ